MRKAQYTFISRDDIVAKMKKKRAYLQEYETMGDHQLLEIAMDRDCVPNRNTNKHQFYTGEKESVMTTKHDAIWESIKAQVKQSEVGVKKGEMVKVTTRMLNASELTEVKGVGIYPVYAIESRDNVDVKVLTDIKTQPEMVKMPINSPLYKLVMDKKVKVCKTYIEQWHSPIYDENKGNMLSLFIDLVYSKQPNKVVLCSKPGREKALIYIADKEVWDNFFGCDIYTKDGSKLVGYTAPKMAEVLSYNKIELKALVVDSESVGSQLVHDGNMFINGKHVMEIYQNEKSLDKRDGRKILKEVSAVQCRIFQGGVIKALAVMDSNCHHDMIKSYGYEPSEYDAILDKSNIKAGSYNHGDTYKFDVSSIHIINKLSKGATSNIGVQGTCLDPSIYSLLISELKVIDKANILKKAISGNAHAIQQVIGELDPDRTMEDWETIAPKMLWFSILNKDGEYISPLYKSNYTTIVSRFIDYYQQQILKLEVSKMAFYAIGCPILLKDKGKLDCALSIYEREQDELTNFVVCTQEDISKFESKIYNHCYRNPVVSPASLQQVKLLPAFIAKRLIASGFKSISISKCGKYGIHSVKRCLMVSQDFAKTCFVDFD